MIPPCDPAILENNPQFKKLYQHLTTELLNPDGSTRANDAHPARKAVQNELRELQIRNAKRQIKKRALERVALDLRSVLPDELRDLIAIIALYLQSPMPSEEFTRDIRDGEDMLSLLSPDFETFHYNAESIARALSKLFSSNLDTLRAIAEAGAEASQQAPIPSHIPSLANQSRLRARPRQSSARMTPQVTVSSQVSARMAALRALQLAELPAARRKMAATAAAVFAVRGEIMERTVELLERTKHGALARASKSKAEHLATVAEAVEGKVRVMKLETLSAIYTPDALAALTNYRDHLRDSRRRLEEKEKSLIKELESYEGTGSAQENNAGVGTMAEIARRYGALLKEMEAVKMEVKRLGG
ncbi:hypothetical protein DTO021C3_500 [Paecilomyces variotii]|nr:hypothetical protein DTO021C3_500 [Paecilomyces variotii]